jgi:hypothetical protein
MIGVPKNTAMVHRTGISDKMKYFMEDAERNWNLSKPMVLGIMLLPVIIALSAAILSVVDWELYRWFTGSKGLALMEFVPVLIWYFDLVLSLVVIRKLWGVRERLVALLYLGLSASFVVIIGDKINWGQTFFGMDLSVAYAASIHELQTVSGSAGLVEEVFRWMQLLVGAYGTILPMVIARWKVPDNLQRRLSFLVPNNTLIPYFFLIFIWRIYRITIFPMQEPNFRIVEYNEIMDLVLSLGFFFFLVFQLQALGRIIPRLIPASTRSTH